VIGKFTAHRPSLWTQAGHVRGGLVITCTAQPVALNVEVTLWRADKYKGPGEQRPIWKQLPYAATNAGEIPLPGHSLTLEVDSLCIPASWRVTVVGEGKSHTGAFTIGAKPQTLRVRKGAQCGRFNLP
jgi:hypothetical protein